MMEYFNVQREGKYIRGAVHRPEVRGKVPCVIICHGFTGNKVGSHFMLVKIARMLESIGIATFRFDFLGSGESDGDFIDMTLSGEVLDFEKVLDYVKSLDYIDKDNINVLGYSMGAAVAVIGVNKRQEEIKDIILMSPAVNIFHILVSNLRGEAFEYCIEKGFVDLEGNLVSVNLLKDMYKYDMRKTVENLKGRVMLIHGTNDESVSPMISVILKELLEDKADLKLIKGSDHSYSAYIFEKQLLEAIKDFCKVNIC